MPCLDNPEPNQFAPAPLRSGWCVDARRRFFQLLMPVTVAAGMLALAMLVGGCEAFDSLSSGSGGSPDPKAHSETQGTFSGTLSYLDFLGAVMIPLGIGIAIARRWFPVFPRGAGILTAIAGLVLMLATDLLRSHPWMIWIGLIGLILFGIVELIGRNAVVRWLKQAGQALKDNVQELR